MQFGCDASLLNKIRQSCLDCAHNRKIYNLLTRICYKAPFNCSPESVSEGLTVQKVFT